MLFLKNQLQGNISLNWYVNDAAFTYNHRVTLIRGFCEGKCGDCHCTLSCPNTRCSGYYLKCFKVLMNPKMKGKQYPKIAYMQARNEVIATNNNETKHRNIINYLIKQDYHRLDCTVKRVFQEKTWHVLCFSVLQAKFLKLRLWISQTLSQAQSWSCPTRRSIVIAVE